MLRARRAGRARRARCVAADVAFELMRIADPAVGSPVVATFAKIDGFAEFARAARGAARGGRRASRRGASTSSTRRPGGIAGVRVARRSRARDRARRAVSAAPLLVRDAVHGAGALGGGRATTTARTGATSSRSTRSAPGPFRLAPLRQAAAASCSSAIRTGTALRHPEWRAPGGRLSHRGRARRRGAGPPRSRLRRPAAARSSTASSSAIEKEDIPTFNKFLQGYYDASGILQESFDQMVHEGALSPEMAARGMQLAKRVDPDVYYIGFNMDDPVVGHAGRRARAQAAPGDEPRDRRASSSLRVFKNGRGVPAQSPIPPGHLRLRRRLPESLPAASTSSARARCSPRPATRTASIPATRQAAAPHLRPRRHLDRAAACASSSS